MFVCKHHSELVNRTKTEAGVGLDRAGRAAPALTSCLIRPPDESSTWWVSSCSHSKECLASQWYRWWLHVPLFSPLPHFSPLALNGKHPFLVHDVYQSGDLDFMSNGGDSGASEEPCPSTMKLAEG